MKITLINLFACPECRGTLLPLIIKKTKERVFEADLKCEKCGKRFHIKDGIAYFIFPLKKQTAREKRELRKITLKQEISKTWLRLFPKQELVALKKEWKWMLSVVKKEKNAVHLDFAAGTGRFLRNIIPKTKGEIIALDYGYSTCLELQYFLRKIKKYNRVSIVCADARKMPFKDGVFDSITTWHGLDEVKIEESLKETRRILKDRAYFVASGLHYQQGSKSFLIAKKEHIQFMTKEAIMEPLKKSGFRKIQHKTFFQGRWNEKESYLPIFGDFYSTYAIKAKK